jgi:Tfp pilus assembly protein PilV
MERLELEDMTMKFAHAIKNNAGIGLIEVLLTTVVVAVGLLSVASLQGDLMGGSRTNKTRAEAQALANTKIEQLRDTIEQSGATGYTALASSGSSESVSGVSETFTRSWTVTNLTNPTRKQVSVTVSWGDASAENQVVGQSVIAFSNLGNSGLAAEGAGDAASAVSGPSTNAESSDDITETVTLSAAEPVGSVTTVGGKTYIVQDTGLKAVRANLCNAYSPVLTAFENGLYTRRVDHDGVSGSEAIELYEKVDIGGAEYCIPRIRYNGGVIIPIRGIVHSGATEDGGNNQTLLDVNLFTFNTSESGTYCVFSPESGAKSAPYVCYVGGNCDGYTGTVSSDVTACPGSISASKVGPGGWRGKVGLLGVASNGNNVCFAEEIAGTPETADTARNYFSLNSGLNEGINKPYNCHDFLIINGQNTMAQLHSECVTQANAIAGLHLASKTIQRTIASGSTVFDPVIDATYCEITGTDYTITGTIVNAASAPTVTITDLVSTNNCTATANSYSCDITTSAASVTVSGTYNNETVSCMLTPVSTTGCALTFTPTVNPTYTINGTITGSADAANAVTMSISDGGVCANNNNGTYTCTLTTAASTASATLTPTISTGGTVTPTTDTVALNGSTGTLTGPSFHATMASTYTISGSISIGNNVSVTTVTVAVDTGTGTCSLTGNHAENSTDTYSCTVASGANHLSIAISPACTTGSGSKKYQMTDGTTATVGTGGLAIDLGTVNTDVVKNITISKTTTNC